jgi:hypothetical protein
MTDSIAKSQSATENRHHDKCFSHGITPSTFERMTGTMSGCYAAVMYHSVYNKCADPGFH